MKKGIFIFVMTALLSNSFAQYVCFDSTKAYNTRGGCTRVVPTDIYDTGLLSLSFIPNDSTPLITIPVNINVWRKDDGTGNYWQDTPAFRDSLRLAFEYLNIIYSQNQPYCLNIPNSQFIADTRVRFVIDTVFYYNNTEMALKTYPAPFVEYLLTHHPDRLNHFTYHLSIDTTAYWWGYSSGYNSDYPSVVSVRQHTYKSLYAFALHMAHEFGHNFGLGHPYDSEITTIAHPEFLWDVFGTATQSWCTAPPTKVCHHDAGWDCDPCTPYNTCTNNIMGGSYAARHFSALQCGRIQRALQVSSLRRFAYGEENPAELHINRNQLIDYTRKYYQTVIVDSGATLTVTCRVEMVSSARLIVRPGGKLVVDGGTLTSACDGEMWQGIEVVGDRTKSQTAANQGVVELRNGAVIENAWCGIRTGLREDTLTFATTGGIITAEDATFRNNRQSVVINSYAHATPSGNITNYNASFIRCTFTIGTNNLFAANNTDFAEHVRLWDVKGIPFKGCTFNNEADGGISRGRGIYVEDAGLSLDVKCPDNYISQPGDCGCSGSGVDSCTFLGFTTAVEVNTSGNPYAVEANRAYFENNVTALHINGNDYATVTRCRFDLTSLLGDARGNHGLYLNECTGYKVEGNTFMRTVYPTNPLAIDNSTGIYVKNSGTAYNSLYRNDFKKLTKGISVSGNNSSLQVGCNVFSGDSYDIFIPYGSSIAMAQGSLANGADNEFDSTRISSIYNGGIQKLTYYFSSGSGHTPTNPNNVTLNSRAGSNSCFSTLCDSPYVPLLSGFQSDMDEYTTALAANADADGTGNGNAGANDYSPLQQDGSATLSETAQTLAETYYAAVRALMSDSLLDLATLEQWHTAAQPIADPYSLTETRFMEGYSETFDASTAGHAPLAENAETANYADFHAMKLALRNQNDNPDNQDNDNSPNLPNSPTDYSPTVNWYALTPAQIAQLQTIAERNAGRASVMAKGVLCFFFGICYEDDPVETQNFASLQQGNDGNDTLTKRAATDIADDAALFVYPNPTDDLLHIELVGAGIATIALYDLQGRVVGANNYSPLRGTTATVNMRNVPAGVYVLRVTDAEGREYHQKVVRR